MQEGPHWYFQDYPMEQQIWFYNCLMEMDVIFGHNQADVDYFKGLTQKENIYQNKSLMITDSIEPHIVNPDARDGVIIGGNMVRWYGGFDSYMVAQEADCPIYIPSMGRKIEGEEQMPNLNHLPYMNWVEWIKTLNNFKYGVHLMRTHAAGTFALNCAYLGIPCIGYKGLDTQEILHPLTTVEVGDIDNAKHIAKKLKNDKFYKLCMETTLKRYESHYTEKIFVEHWNRIWS